jgi:hypothetical protein
MSVKLKYGRSLRHDRAVDHCRSLSAPCPFGCVKDGGPNCLHNVWQGQCLPAQATAISSPGNTEVPRGADERGSHTNL